MSETMTDMQVALAHDIARNVRMARRVGMSWEDIENTLDVVLLYIDCGPLGRSLFGFIGIALARVSQVGMQVNDIIRVLEDAANEAQLLAECDPGSMTLERAPVMQ